MNFEQWLNKKIVEHINSEGAENCNESYSHYKGTFIEEWEEYLDELVREIGYFETVQGLKAYGITSDIVANALGIPF